jgi:hypothetical protein
MNGSDANELPPVLPSLLLSGFAPLFGKFAVLSAIAID